MPKDEESGYEAGISPLIHSFPDRAKEVHNCDELEDLSPEDVEGEVEKPTEEKSKAAE